MRRVLLGNLFLNPFTPGWASSCSRAKHIFVPRGTPHGGMLCASMHTEILMISLQKGIMVRNGENVSELQ